MIDPTADRWLIRALRLILVLLVGWNLFAYHGVENEQFTSRHYFPKIEVDYGGYGQQYFVYPDRLRPIHRETEYNFRNLAALQNNAPPPGRGDFVAGYDGAGRMFSSGFLPAVVQRLSLGALNIHDASMAVNALLWAIAACVAFQFAARGYPDRYSRYLAASIVVSYPIFSLMFQSLKMQYAHSVLVLLGIYLAHFVLRRAGLLTSTIAFTALFWMGSFTGGGFALLLLAIVVWLFVCHTVGRNTTMMAGVSLRSSGWVLVAACAGFAIALVSSDYVRQIHDLPRGNETYSIQKTFFIDPFIYLKALALGTDRSQLLFLGFRGDQFFTHVLGLFVKSLWELNPFIFAGAIAGFIFHRDSRPLLLTAAFLFIPSHAPELLVGWAGPWGYGNAPTMLLVIVAFAGMLGRLMSSAYADRRLAVAARAAAIVLFACSVGFFFHDRHHQVDNYYFSWDRLDAVKHIHVYHDAKYTAY